MSRIGITDLPAELLDRVYWYLDWDRTVSCVPAREDIHAISLTCKHLRASVVPLLFRYVRLSLRWADGQLLEPSLYRLRRFHPELAQHVRCVYIDTKHRYQFGPQRSQVPFRVPDDLEDWLNPEMMVWRDSQHYVALNAAHRQRVNEIVTSLDLSALNSRPLMPESMQTAEATMRQIIGSTGHISRTSPGKTRRLYQPVSETSAGTGTSLERIAKNRVDALAVVMLCLPSTVTSIVFEAAPASWNEEVQSNFVLQTLVAALKVFAPRIESLTTIRGDPIHQRNRGRYVNLGRDQDVKTDETITASLLNELTCLKTLVLSDHQDLGYKEGHRMARLGPVDFQRYHTLSATISHLEVWNVDTYNDDDLSTLLSLARGFANLRHLAFRKMHSGNRALTLVWLNLAIELRRSLPNSQIIFDEISAKDPLPESALHWIMEEAIPRGAAIDYDRVERLTEDFVSFLPLWAAESSDRGIQAAKEREGGELVEAAMCSRWQIYSNVRRDRGQWTSL